jgi:hypothetical protein
MNIITIMAIKELIVIDVIHIYSTTNWLWKLLQGCWERWHFSKNNTLEFAMLMFSLPGTNSESHYTQ